ncbi:metal ABC transporter permease [Catenulispora sp. NF23]|uniref:High-affinity zinc uptake system membrane protein ZnuB n=1 Tax=Catenulispora pinistramenti TaxID=2705254 RepID=A0ABS5KRD1_9ACTN|nr:metal ABC transporter permease [Catenulispora pinistramenti]MBS2534842.1 metal ABC transporter permease [Catenulispora pinistramenti]MBS2548615.1 metal ABC transporter permease [Catenulispora pinistramenti]
MPADSGLSWNLLSDIDQMWKLDSMVNAYRAGTIVAVLAAVVGWFVVLRRQTFVAHTVSLAGFPGAAAAVFLGVSASWGYFGFCIGAAAVIAALARSGKGGMAEESALTGIVQSFTLACGMLFVALYKGFLNGVNSLLFGSFLGVTPGDIAVLAAVAAVVLLAMALIGRPLLFASVDPAVADARGVPSRTLSLLFLVLLGATAAEVSQITGSLLVFALLVMPAATAQRITARPGRSLVLSVVFALAVTWFGLGAAYFSPYPIGFWITTFAFGCYLLANLYGFVVRWRGAGRRHMVEALGVS